MPYINQERRDVIDAHLPLPHVIQSVGELNYAFTKLALDFLGCDPNYADFNDVVGVLECCKLEFYRRACSPYEDRKIAQSGDVY